MHEVEILVQNDHYLVFWSYFNVRIVQIEWFLCHWKANLESYNFHETIKPNLEAMKVKMYEQVYICAPNNAPSVESLPKCSRHGVAHDTSTDSAIWGVHSVNNLA